MSMENNGRRSGVFVGTGSVSDFPFTFKVFSPDQVVVYRRIPGEAVETLVPDSEYSVQLQSEAGGTVSFSVAPAKGTKLVIVSNIPYTQGLGLNNFGRFNPDELNGAWDKNTALIQQVLDLAHRSVQVPQTSTETPAEFTDSIFKARDEAVASASAAKASETNAGDSATSAAADAVSAKESADNAMSSEQLAESSAQTARDEAAIAVGASQAAKTSATNAQVSETNARAYEQEAQRYATDAARDAASARVSSEAAKASELEAKASADKASASEVSAKSAEDTATTQAEIAYQEAERAKRYADSAAAGQLQADWNQTDTGQPDYIKNKPDVAGLETRVGTVEAGLTSKADKTYVDAGLTSKADKTYVDAGLTSKADKTYVDTEISVVEDRLSTAENTLTTKANQTYVDGELDKKFDKTGGEISGEVKLEAGRVYGSRSKSTLWVCGNADENIDSGIVSGARLFLSSKENYYKGQAALYVPKESPSPDTADYMIFEANPDGSFKWDTKEIERVNSSGDGWIRYESGLQICFGEKTEVKDMTSPWGALYTNVNDKMIISYPQPFSTPPKVIPMATPNGVEFVSAIKVSANETNCEVTVSTASGSKTSISLAYIAIGRRM